MENFLALLTENGTLLLCAGFACIFVLQIGLFFKLGGIRRTLKRHQKEQVRQLEALFVKQEELVCVLAAQPDEKKADSTAEEEKLKEESIKKEDEKELLINAVLSEVFS